MAVITALAIGAAAAVASTAVGVAGANKQRRSAQRNKSKADREIESLKKSRQSIINPYAGAKNLSGLAKDTSLGLGNPFASLGVATSAAEIQIEEADIALANTLDTLRATGASAGGATALAQAALQSKKGVAANIEQQEARNEELKARGQQQLDQIKMSEQQRLQNVSISEGQRLQTTDAAGKQFVFEQQENRTNADLDRASGQERQAQQNISDANSAKSSAIAGGFSAIGSMAGSVVGAGGLG
jgi:hypothetical protein|tara:strand:- start:431 stop:1162 length:732 start_codon:yes stop_codon:yes gene_type:complete